MIFYFFSVRTPSLFEEGSGSHGGKGRIAERFLSPLRLIDTVNQRELHFLRKLHLEGLDLAVTREEVAELVLGHGRGEALDVQVASLLGALVLDGLAEALSLAVRALKCFFDIKLFVIGQGNAINHRLAVKLLDGLLGTAGSVLAVVLVIRVEADEGVGALIVAHVLHGLDAAELGEKGANVLLREVVGEVLGVDVVVDLAEVALVAGLVADDLDAVGSTLGFEGLGSRGGVLEADETVAAGLVVRVKRDLQRLNVTVTLEVLLESLGSDLLGDAAHEDVVVDDLLGVGAEQVIVEGEGAGGLSIGELEVAHLLAGKRELVLLRDGHNSRVEGAVQVTADLGHALEHDAGLRLQDGCEASAGGLRLGQVVKIQVVLGSLGCVHYHFNYFFFGSVWI